MNTKKVLITGASGLLGRALVSEFTKESWDVLGLAFSRTKEKLIKVDLNDSEAVRSIVKKCEPDIIVHAAAQRSPDIVEKHYEESHKLNVICSKQLAELSAAENIGFLYISTDYVFDGSNPPYKESEKTNALNAYGKTKAEAEQAVMKANENSCILRIPVLYGEEEYVGESAISSLIPFLLDAKTPRNISDYEVRFPSHADDIAVICCQMAHKMDSSMKGVYHWCGSEPFTKYTMAKTMAEVFSMPFSHITPNNEPSPGAKRPKNTQLCKERLDSLGIGQHTAFRDGIRKSFSKFMLQLDKE